MSSARKAMAKWGRLVMQAPSGAQFEVGLTWDKSRGWRPYQRVGDHALMLTPEAARKIVDTYARLGTEPKWKAAYADMADIFAELRSIADECDQKNRDRVVPDQAAAFMPAEGHA